MRRVMVMVRGRPGSGKGTAAPAPGAVAGLPVARGGRLRRRAGRVGRPREGKTRPAPGGGAGEAWSFAGEPPARWGARAGRADLLVRLGEPVGLRLRRGTRRPRAHDGRSRPPAPPRPEAAG